MHCLHFSLKKEAARSGLGASTAGVRAPDDRSNSGAEVVCTEAVGKQTGKKRSPSEFSITSSSLVVLTRSNVARLVIQDEESCLVYHSAGNSRIHMEKSVSPLKLPIECAESVEALLLSYPDYIQVGDLPTESKEEAVALCIMLHEAGVILRK